MKVAYYSPLPPERSGIADYSALLLRELRRRLDVVVMKRGRRRPPRGTDVCLYHIGNDPETHGWIVEALRGWPGVVVLHEFVLHHLVAGLTLGRRDVSTYLAAMEREGGLAARLLAHGVVERSVPPLWEHRPEDFPLAGFILDATRDRGVIVHSRFVAERVRETGYSGPLWRIPHPAWPEPRTVPVEVSGSPLIGCLGHLNQSKRIPQLLEAFARLRETRPRARLLLVGAVSPRFDLTGKLELLELDRGDAVVHEDYVDETRLWSLMAACDVCVSLRAPTMGETSGSVIRALTLGRPLVVSNIGWFAELPDDAALKVPVDEHEVATLHAALELLAANEDARRAMGAAARAYVAEEHALERVAEAYTAALEEAAGGRAVRQAVLRDVAHAAADVGIGPDEREASELARRLAEVGLGE